jgi:hypothetical protein
MKRLVIGMVLAFVLILPAHSGLAQGADPGAVVDAYTAAINTGNVDAAIAFVADNAVYNRPGGQFVGKDQVRGFIEGLVERQAQIELLGSREVYGEYVRWSSHVTFGNPGSGPTDSRNNSQSIVHQGRIVFHMATPAQ